MKQDGITLAREDSRAREQLIVQHTEFFGGSTGENEEKLAGLAIAQIYEAIRSDRTSQGGSR